MLSVNIGFARRMDPARQASRLLCDMRPCYIITRNYLLGNAKAGAAADRQWQTLSRETLPAAALPSKSELGLEASITYAGRAIVISSGLPLHRAYRQLQPKRSSDNASGMKAEGTYVQASQCPWRCKTEQARRKCIAASEEHRCSPSSMLCQ